MKTVRFCSVIAMLCGGVFGNAVGQSPDFHRQIRPLLSDRCLACHGPDSEHREADLRLDSADDLLRDRGGYAVVVPGHPETSELIRRIMSADADEVMPPGDSGKPLTAEEKNLLIEWVRSGGEVSPHWAYVAPVAHEVPRTVDSDWSRGWIDEFVLSRLQAEGVSPSPDADHVTLLRRVFLDLTGLPPTPEDVDRFAADQTEDRWEQIVDRLLASDAHAERMAMYWLDLVRYADTVGYHGDQDHNISPYRDWVIDAFAENMPFDQFTREQLAGDLLPDSDVDQKIASGYNRLLQTSHEGGVQPKEYLAIYAADRVRNLSAVWMGATVGCAQCHDHKYDPYTMRDFYSLAAYFADLDEAQHFRVGTNTLPTKRPPEIRVLTRRERDRLDHIRRQIAQVEQRLAEQQTEELLRQKTSLQQQAEHLQASARQTMISVSTTPRVVRVLPRGNWLDDSGPEVQPAVPEFLGTAAMSQNGRSNRLDLANWLCDTENGVGGLTARVFVNRLWFLVFGQGLARDLDDFGGQGAPPDHPQLLDRLALELTDSGWNVRHVLKQIVMSRTYRQSSVWTPRLRQRDPENRLLARQNSFRLPAEMIRDSALLVSGLLVRMVGGPSVKPYQPAGYYRHLNFPQRKYKADTDERQWRRGLYVHWQRQFLHPMLRAFDAPSREECTAQRPQSNTPLAALTLLNDPTFTEAARAFAARLLSARPEDDVDARLDSAVRLALSRSPDAEERALLRQLLDDAMRYYTSHPQDADRLLAVGLSDQGRSRNHIELAAWTAVTRALINLDEFITRY